MYNQSLNYIFYLEIPMHKIQIILIWKQKIERDFFIKNMKLVSQFSNLKQVIYKFSKIKSYFSIFKCIYILE